MANAQQIFQLKAQMPYLGDGVAAALEGVLRYLPLDAELADSVSYSVFQSEFTGTAGLVIDSGAGSRPLAVVVESRGQAGWLRLFNISTTTTLTASGDVDPDATVGFATSTGEITAVSWHGAGWTNMWTAGICASVATTAGHAKTQMTTNLPRIHVLFRNV